MIKLKPYEWWEVRAKIEAKHGKAMALVRDKMKRELRFTPREHYEDGSGYVFIDFYDDVAETMFRLEYL